MLINKKSLATQKELEKSITTENSKINLINCGIITQEGDAMSPYHKIIKKHRKFLHEFMRSKDGSLRDNGWWEIIGNKVYNICGGYHDYKPSEDDIIVSANDWDELDWSCMLEDDSQYGWVDVHGRFYGCDYMKHNEVAEMYFKCTERELENAGFVKIYRDYDGTRSYYVAKYLTERQEKALIDMGISIREEQQ